VSEHSFKRDEYFSAFKFVTGRYNYGSDIDLSITSEDSVEEIFEEANELFDTVCIIDAKRQTKGQLQKVSNRWYAMKYQIKRANKEQIPFFSICTYLDPSWNGEYSYYLIPNNKYARQLLEKHAPTTPNGIWLSLQGFSQFLHFLRGKKWNPNEPIKLQDRWNKIVQLSDISEETGYRLKDLPNTIYHHPLPEIERITFTLSEQRLLGEI
jgi:hypothetical protein